MRKIYPLVFIVLALFVPSSAQTEQKSGFIAAGQKVFSIGAAKLINQSIIEKNESKMFEIKAEYPEMTGANPAVAARFNQLVKDTVMKEVEQFRGAMLTLTDADLNSAGESGVGNYLEMRYGIGFASERVLSIGFGNAVYGNGAQPNEYSFTINFDLKNGKKIELSDLFKPDSNYLKFISDYSIRSLKRNLEDLSDDEWLENGAGARAENFHRWAITKKGILIHFDPFQVAAYAAGPKEILIPYSDLKGILSENSVVSQL